MKCCGSICMNKLLKRINYYFVFRYSKMGLVSDNRVVYSIKDYLDGH